MAHSDPPSAEHIESLLRGVIDPELGSDIVELGMVPAIAVDSAGAVTITVALTTLGCPLRAQIKKDIQTRIGGLPGVTDVAIAWSELSQPEKAVAMATARRNIAEIAPETEIPATTKVILVASGKGGVGKSSVTVNLASALASRGHTVGVLDADIWGYSVPRMLGVDGRLRGATDDQKMLPHIKSVGAGELKIISMGFLVDAEETALMWRGLILNRAVRHFLEDVRWGPMDYLFVDMPPGTGDVQMGIAKLLPRAEMIIVTTPAEAAQKVAVRAANMGRNNYLRIVGVIENMSAFVAPDGAVYELFGSGGGAALAAEVGVPLLGQIPIDGLLAAGGDNGRPIALESGPSADAFQRIAEIIVTETVPPFEMAGCSVRLLDDLNAPAATAPAETAVIID